MGNADCRAQCNSESHRLAKGLAENISATTESQTVKAIQARVTTLPATCSRIPEEMSAQLPDLNRGLHPDELRYAFENARLRGTCGGLLDEQEEELRSEQAALREYTYALGGSSEQGVGGAELAEDDGSLSHRSNVSDLERQATFLEKRQTVQQRAMQHQQQQQQQQQQLRGGKGGGKGVLLTSPTTRLVPAGAVGPVVFPLPQQKDMQLQSKYAALGIEVQPGGSRESQRPTAGQPRQPRQAVPTK